MLVGDRMNKRECARFRKAIKKAKELVEQIRDLISDATDVEDEPTKYANGIIEDLYIRLDDVEGDLDELDGYNEEDDE